MEKSSNRDLVGSFVTRILFTGIMAVFTGIIEAVFGFIAFITTVVLQGFPPKETPSWFIQISSIGVPYTGIIGVFLWDRLFHYRGSLLLGILGVILAGLSVELLLTLTGVHWESVTIFDRFAWFIILASSVLGAIGYHLRARKVMEQ